LSIIFSPIYGLPLIKDNDNLGSIIIDAINESKINLQNGDIIVVTQKIISKAEGRLVNLNDVSPGHNALKYAKITQKDPRLVELILSESKSVIRATQGVFIVEHKNGFICANAGIDHSNVEGKYGDNDDWYLLLPENPDKSAEDLRMSIETYFGIRIGLLIIDSHGRPWRRGTVGVSIGISGFSPIIDYRGKEDIFGFELKVTEIGAADELAAGASLAMGQADERIPVVHVRGYPYNLGCGNSSENYRNSSEDLFR